jgi:hypothetical protein
VAKRVLAYTIIGAIVWSAFGYQAGVVTGLVVFGAVETLLWLDGVWDNKR